MPAGGMIFSRSFLFVFPSARRMGAVGPGQGLEARPGRPAAASLYRAQAEGSAGFSSDRREGRAEQALTARAKAGRQPPCPGRGRGRSKERPGLSTVRLPDSSRPLLRREVGARVLAGDLSDRNPERSLSALRADGRKRFFSRRIKNQKTSSVQETSWSFGAARLRRIPSPASVFHPQSQTRGGSKGNTKSR